MRNAARWLVALALAIGSPSGALHAGAPRPQNDPASSRQEPDSNKLDRNGQSIPATAETAPLSDAERIARLQRAIAENEQHLEELRSGLNDPQDEYIKAEAEFGLLDRDFQEKKKNLQKEEGAGSGNAEALAAEIAALEPQWNLAKERFDLAIAARKALQEQIATFEQRVRQDQEALKKLTESKPAAPVQTQTQTPAPAEPSEGAGSPSAPPPATTLPGIAAPPAEARPEPAQTPAQSATPGAAGQAPPPSSGLSSPPAAKPTPPSRDLVKAREEAGQKAGRGTAQEH